MGATLSYKQVKWLDGLGAKPENVVASRAVLARNFPYYPFPDRASVEERRTIEERALTILEATQILSRGQYVPSDSLNSFEIRFLEERQLLPEGFSNAGAHAGVFMSDDQTFSIVVNCGDHVTFRAMASGLELDAVWNQVNALDDQFSKVIDFAFDERRGFLVSRVDCVGTGLKLSAIVHLPALTIDGNVSGLDQRVREQRHALHGAFGGGGLGAGDFYLLTNQCSLGRSEAEVVFHLRHIVNDLIVSEADVRARMAKENGRALEDRVGRALGVARGARFLELPEALDILSAVRLGVITSVLPGYALRTVNELLVEAQQGHLELKAGQECDSVTLSAERADLFRARLQ